MKLKAIIGTLSLALAASAFAGNPSCDMPPASKCFMMPSSEQNSRENLTWIGLACCIPANNISADVSGQNSRHAILTSGRTSAKIGTTSNVYSEKGGQYFVREVEVR